MTPPRLRLFAPAGVFPLAAVFAFAAFAAFAQWTGVARAETPPTAWDVARDPAARDRWDLHMRVQRLLHPPAGEGGLRFDDELRIEAACAMLEDGDAARSPDVRLRFDLGIVYSELASRQRRTDLQQKVIDVLAPAHRRRACGHGRRRRHRRARGPRLRVREARIDPTRSSRPGRGTSLASSTIASGPRR